MRCVEVPILYIVGIAEIGGLLCVTELSESVVKRMLEIKGISQNLMNIIYCFLFTSCKKG